MNRNKKNRNMLAWSVAAVLAGFATAAAAQDDARAQPQPTGARDSAPTTLDALIVTAQKREEEL